MKNNLKLIVWLLAAVLFLPMCEKNHGGISSAKAITAFSFTAPASTAIIDETAKTISVTVPNGTDVTALIATFATSGASVKIGEIEQVSGVTVNNFSTSVLYTVTAEDKSTVQYVVTVLHGSLRELYVANNNGLLVLDATLGGNANPIRNESILLSNSFRPLGIALDRVNNEIFLNFGDTIVVVANGRTNTGELASIRTISGSNTGLNSLWGIAVDTVNNEIFITNTYNESITVYGRSDSGNVTPIRTIYGVNTGLWGPIDIRVDTIHNEIVVANSSGSIMVFGRTDNGNVSPLRSITGANTGLIGPDSIVLDTINNEIIVGNFRQYGAIENAGTNGGLHSAAYTISTILTFNRTDNGDVAPVRTISGENTGLNDPEGIAVDTINNEIFVSNYLGTSVTVYDRTDTGNVAPRRTIAGANSGLSGPSGIALW